MNYDLRVERWIPFRRRTGIVEWLPPFALTDDSDGDNPIVALAAPRPDFNAALLEFLIGLFSVALALPDEEAWRALANAPPSPEEVRARLMALPTAFNLAGDGPRFLQDFEAADFAKQADLPIENLLIDAAGENTQKLNKDLFVKRGRADVLGRPAAAMALITLQSYAPSGGQGHRTSMRGGGPLTTLVEPRADGRVEDATLERPLWELIHANLLLAKGDDWLPEDWQSEEGREIAPLIWPWLAPTLTSGQKPRAHEVVPQDAHAFQALFGMPRRLRLVFSDGPGTCALTGMTDAQMVTAYRTINFGVNYGSGLWVHPLSPHYEVKNQKLPVHPQPDGLGWKDWAGLVVDQSGKSVQYVAETVARYRGLPNRPFAVRAFGYDMDNMKARGWAETILPAWPLASAAVSTALTQAATQMTEATRQVANLLVGAVIAARFNRKEDAKGDFSFIKAELWAATETAFYDRVDAAVRAGEDHAHAIVTGPLAGKAFIDVLRIEAARIFDEQGERIGLDVANEHRFVMARRNLMMALRGYGKGGTALFTTLGMAAPEKASKKNKETTA
ncbi:MAG TPA: type I-E CRISPR-associated protein Cse1/CasA [Chakrabartia sp.]|nr:type I-E CRISPR-associated protein Cse1/CasA [Chakrabartia sp.]